MASRTGGPVSPASGREREGVPVSPLSTSPLALETLRKFRLIVGAVRQHSRALEKVCGMSGTQVWMLATIADRPDIRVSELGQALSIHVSTTSNLLDKLARAGLIERMRSEEDRRVVRLRLTDAGRAAIERAPKPLTGPISDALAQMPEGVLSRLDANLAELIGHMSDIDQRAADEPLSNLVR
jgi:DNA-binding MarR family transcriptional regulator